MFQRFSLGAAALLVFVACAKTAPPAASPEGPSPATETTLVQAPSAVDADAGVVAEADDDIEAIDSPPAAPGDPDVTLTFNVARIRTHPLQRSFGALMRALPPWPDVPPGKAGAFDAFRDTDWLTIAGPTLVHDDKNVMLIGHSAAEAVVERAILELSKTGGATGAFATGVPGVKATLVKRAQGARVFLRSGSKLVVVAPPDRAKDLARRLQGEDLATKVIPTEAVRLVVRNPRRQISTPRVKLPEELVELRMVLVPHDDGSVTLLVEGTVTPTTACAEVAGTLNDALKKSTEGMVRMVTGGMLDSAAFACKRGMPKLRVEVSQEQLERLVSFAALSVGVPYDR